MQNRLVSHLRMAVEHLEGYLGCGGPPFTGGVRSFTPTSGLPRPGFQCWDEESPHNLVVKIGRDSDCPGEM